jgi:enediyne biosynthesis protein E4
MTNVDANRFLKLVEPEQGNNCTTAVVKNTPAYFIKADQLPGLDFKHSENNFSDFDRDRLLFQMLSNEGPHMAIADINNDNLDDIYICGAKDSPGSLYIQDNNGHFKKTNGSLFEADKISEETDCAFFDADGDGDKDLYVACGGNEFPESSSALSDRLYFNDGKGVLTKSDQILPDGKYESTSCVQPADFDNDGDIDLFVGIRLVPFSYGLPTSGYLLENNGHGIFSDVTAKLAPALTKIGMITDMVWADIDNDSDLDIVIVGDWMPVKILVNSKNTFTDESERYKLSGTEGWWHTIVTQDLNGDGLVDFILGNHGLNSSFKASAKEPVNMYVNDFDLNGSVEQIICAYYGNESFPIPMKDDLVNQIPSLALKYKKFADYKDQTINDIFAADILKRSVVQKATLLESSVMINSGKGSFSLTPLPVEAQFAPVYAIMAKDFDNDGITDIILGGNQGRAKPETGIYNASYGLFLKGSPDGKYSAVSTVNSGIFTKGEIRDIAIMSLKDKKIIVVARNNDNLEFYKF